MAQPEYIEKLHMVPAHMHRGIVDWIEHGHASYPGSFLTALLSNNLVEAFGRADDDNIAAMHSWVRYLYNYAPSGCFGSPAKFEAWTGLNAREAEAA